MSNVNQKESEIFVNSVLKEKNIKAEKTLKKIIANKCRQRIKTVLEQ